MYHLHVVPTEARKEHQIPELEFYVIVSSLKQLFEPNPGPSQEKQTVLTVEPSFQL